MKRTISCQKVAISLLAIGLFQTVSASQPAFRNVRVTTKLAAAGASFAEITNLKRVPVTVFVQSGPMSTIPIKEQSIRIEGNGTAVLNLGDLFYGLPDGVHAIQLLPAVQYDNGAREEGPVVYEPVKLGGGEVVKISFEDAFLSKQTPVLEKSDTAVVDLGAGYIDRSPMPDKMYEAHPVDPKLPIKTFDLPRLEDMIAMKPNQVGDPGGFEMDGRLTGGGTRMFETRAFSERSFASPVNNLNPDPDPDQTVEVTVKGKFFLKAIDPPSTEVLLPGWAWSARIWEFVGFWKYRGQGTVNGSGNWTAKVKLLDPQAQIRITFQPVNRFVIFKKTDGSFWGWSRQWNLSNGTNTGDYAADFTANGDLPGLAQLYWRSMTLWSKMYTNGINVVLPNPIPVTYPNNLSTGHCTRTDDNVTIPWSCSNSSGAIWIAPAHAFGGTAPHELAHSIHRHYWGGMPAGSGGPHDGDKCYNTGLALSEGFANYIAYWTNSTPDSLDTTMRGGIDAESLPSNFCMGPTNEFRVAALMWDTYDNGWEVVDANNADIWRYAKATGFISLFLSNSRNSITDYRPLMKGNNPAWFQTEVDRTFRLNTLIP